MKTKLVVGLLSFFFAIHLACAQDTAFTYQGRLHDNGTAANGNFEFQFILFDTQQFGFPVAPIRTNSNVAVSGGLFTTSIDFGGVFTGSNYWLDVSVRTNGSAGSFTGLTPRQKITPTPYALHSANAAAAVSLSVPLPASNLSGILSDVHLSPNVALLNGNPTFSGTVSANNFSGANGQPLELRVNGVTGFRLMPTTNTPNVIGGSVANLVSNGFFGATIAGGGSLDYPGIGLAPNRAGGNFATVGGGIGNLAQGNINGSGGDSATVGGGYFNSALANNSTIAGGILNTTRGDNGFVGGGGGNTAGGGNSVAAGGGGNTAGGYATTVSGGEANFATNAHSTVSGGLLNTNAGPGSTIGGGNGNTIFSTANDSFIGGGIQNRATNSYSTIGAGFYNFVSGYAATLAGGYQNTNSGPYGSVGGGQGNLVSGHGATIAGGQYNNASGVRATIGGGLANLATNIHSTVAGGAQNAVWGDASTVGGGYLNTNDSQSAFGVISGGYLNVNSQFYTTIGGGVLNTNAGTASTVGGGERNYIGQSGATIAGGRFNKALGTESTVGGGAINTAGNTYSTISGGSQNSALGFGSFVGGGQSNTNSGLHAAIGGGTGNILGSAASFSTIPGGRSNNVSSSYGFAAGFNANALHQGSFVWADSIGTAFNSSGVNQFLIRAAGGVGINKNNPSTALDVNGTVTATAFSGSGSGLTGVTPGAHTHSATDITSGTLQNARLSASVALLTNAQIFSGLKTFADGSGANGLGGQIQVGVTSSSADAKLITFGDGNYVTIGENIADDRLELSGRSIVFTNNGGTGNVGIGRVAVANKLEVEGNASKTTATAWLANSDLRIKTGVQTVENALATLDKVRLVSFHYTDEYRAAHPSIDDHSYLNVIAQEFQNVFPDAVQNSGEKLPNGEEILQVDTYPLTIYSAAAIQELNQSARSRDAEIRSLKSQNASLEKRLSELEQLVQSLAK